MNDPALTVWCASYPKSGNTWIRALLAGVMGDGSVRLKNLVGQGAGNDQAVIFREFGLTPSVLDDDLSYALMNEAGAAIARRSSEPVFRKTHNSFYGTPPRGASHTLRVPCSAVYVVRDPRAVAVSLAYHLGCSQTEAVNVMANGPKINAPHSDRFMTRGCRVAFDWGSWSANVESWLDQADVPVVLVRYEDLCANAHIAMIPVLDKLGLTVPEDRLAQAVEESSFDQLAVQELIEGFSEASAPDRHFFRRGQADGWVDELEYGLEQRIVTDHGDVMRHLGYLA